MVCTFLHLPRRRLNGDLFVTLVIFVTFVTFLDLPRRRLNGDLPPDGASAGQRLVKG